MKLFTILMLLFVFGATANSYSQRQVVSLDLQRCDVHMLFQEIWKQTGLYFVYNEKHVEDLALFDIEVKEKSVEEVLDEVFKNTPLSYFFENNMIYVLRDQRNYAPKDTLKMVSGVVKDKRGEPLPGVTILIKSTRVGITSDKEGKFEMILPRDTVVLVFSFVGMVTQEIKCGLRMKLNVVMEEEVKAVNEVVVTGYQTLDKRDVTGSITTIKASDIMMPTYTSIDQMLQGRVAGMLVMNTSSRVGTSPTIRIRGTSTILGNKDPLWVVDGIIQPDPLPINQSDVMVNDLKTILGNQISWLNPADIDEITVLKDASATAIYGSKAANGVIVITTKKGRADRMTVNYNGNFSFRARPTYDQFNLMNSEERIRFSREAFEAGAVYDRNYAPYENRDTYEGVMLLYKNRKISKEEAEKLIYKLQSANTDWFEVLTRDAFSQNHNLSLSGGTAKVIYNGSIGFSDNAGIEKGNDARNLSGRLRVGLALHPKVWVDLSLTGSVNKNTGYAAGVNPMQYATTTGRSVLAYNDDRTRHFIERENNYPLNNTKTNFLSYNILNEMEHSYSNSEASRVNGTLNFKWNILSGLTYEFVGGINRNINLSESYIGEQTFYMASKYRGYDVGTAPNGSAFFKAAMLPFGGKLYNSTMESTGWNVQNKVLLQKNFSEDHRLNVMLGTEITSTMSKMRASTIWGYLPERGETIVQPTPIKDIVPMGSYAQQAWGILTELYRDRAWDRTTQTVRQFSLFATLAYSYGNRYVLNASIRNDASNRFGQDQNKRFDPTYSFGLSWNVTEEAWMKGFSKVLNQLNFRATYGIQGNALSSVSPDLILKRGGVKNYYNEFQVSVSQLPNRDLSWERTKNWNLGVDIQLLDWITMNVEYYGKKSDVIVEQQIGVEYGRESMKINGGRVTNKGIEYALNITPVRKKDWAWTIGLNSSKNWNKTGIKPIEMMGTSTYLNGAPDRVLKKGYPLSSFWSFSYKGLNHDTGMPEFNLLEMEEGEEFSGDITDFLVYSGHTEPNFTGGLTTRLRWKGLTFGANFSLLLGAKKRLPTPYPQGGRIPDSFVNLNRDLLKRWKKSGDEQFTDFPSLYNAKTDDIRLPNGTTWGSVTMWGLSDIRVVDASFLRCQQLSLSWDIGAIWCAKLGLKSLALNVNVNNVFVVCSKKFDGFDPELGDSVQPKIYSFGINVGF